MEIRIPRLSLVVLIGASGSGKSTFARKHFLRTEVLSSDYCRALVSDDENNLAATPEAFEVLHFVARKRLAAGRLTVIDATNVQEEARKPLIELVHEYHCIPVAIVLNLPEKLCLTRNKGPTGRNLPGHVIQQQSSQLRYSLRRLKREGFSHVFVLESEEEVDAAIIRREPLWNDKTDCHGPFDIFGDVHGCYEELEQLLVQLGYQPVSNQATTLLNGPVYAHPGGRKAIFLGDIVDRGPRIIDTLTLVYNMVAGGQALCVPGNHDIKLMRKLRGSDVQVSHGLAESLAEIGRLPEGVRRGFCETMTGFLHGLTSHYILDGGNLVVAHAGLKKEMQGRGSAKVRDFCLFGETTGESDEFGLPVRYNWAAEYRGAAMVVYGHTPIPEPEWLNQTINIDTGCVFGGKLTALRYPEKELVSFPARRAYCEPVRPLQKEEKGEGKLSAQQEHDDLLDAQDVLGKRIVDTGLRGTVTIREENAIAALEVMSRFAANPKWLIYLPPTMSPSETSHKDGYLEYPADAFAYFRAQGIPRVVCEKKHMGSRAVVIVCRDEEVAAKRFGVIGEGTGIVYTRTGRRFFGDIGLERRFLDRLRLALDKAGFWEEFGTGWVCLDAELMPWSAKAQELLKTQYAAAGAAASGALAGAIGLLEQASQRSDLAPGVTLSDGSKVEGSDIESDRVAQASVPVLACKGNLTGGFDIRDALVALRERQELVSRYITAYRQYCWKVDTIEDFKLAPFHLLATEGKVHTDRDHEWHLWSLEKICRLDAGLLLPTPHRVVEVGDNESVAATSSWWEEITAGGAEGMVVKPHDFVARGKRGLVQPALKCRGREYLRIIYGPEYTLAQNLNRLRARELNTKRSLALREFALGVEALERFVRREPLRRIHECVFGVLALESEPVDPRL